MRCVLVSHTHWDREWYRTFQAFRARLVDAVDHVLELCEDDPGYRFVLDGQSIVIEDYLAIRPQRREALERFVRSGQIAVGPWYVQPDSLLPGGETHVRNLLEGRRVAEALGGASRIAYTPDSFGHPAQLPQLLRGFGLEAFVYWRGNGDELDDLPAEYLWEAPDGTAILACHLSRGYFAAAALDPDPQRAAQRLERLGEALAERASSDQVLLMNGVDHQPPDPHTRAVAEALEKATGWEVVRGSFEDFVERVDAAPLPRYRGELVGGRVANLLPGVWSTRTSLKLRNRSCETALTAWAEPWAALGAQQGLADERPALRLAWRALLENQAHDSLCGCSRDRVHEQMLSRYDASEELAGETTGRVLEHLAGLGALRQTPWAPDPEIAVFNPSAHTRTDRVRLRIDPLPALVPDAENLERTALHPLLRATFQGTGFEVDGKPARVTSSDENGRYRLIEKFPPLDVEFVARDVPAFGWKRFSLRPAAPAPDQCDEGRTIGADDVGVTVAEDGTLAVRFGIDERSGLVGLEDVGDRGDSYDFDPVPGGEVALEDVRVSRSRHPSGIECLEIVRVLRVPVRLDENRARRSDETTRLRIVTRARVAPGARRVDLRVEVDNTAEDHRLRLLFPTGATPDSLLAASTFDVVTRRPGPREAQDWMHPPPSTFAHQGWVGAQGLGVVAPGLPEAEVLPGGVLAITLLRAVGWLSRMDLTSRPQPAGPGIHTPGAQCPGPLQADLWLLPGCDPRAAQDAEAGLRCLVAGAEPRLAPDRSLLALEPRALLLSALKPAESGPGCVVRVLNTTDETLEAHLWAGFPVVSATGVRLDERPNGEEVALEGSTLRFAVPPRALRSVLLVGGDA